MSRISIHIPCFAEPASLSELLATLQGFAERRIDLVLVHGGDGTLRDVLSLLPAAYPDGAPELALMASGNTNLAARVFGHVAPGHRGLTRFVQAARRGRLRRRVCHTLQVTWPDQPDRPPLRGLFLGAAGYADGKRLADAEIHRRGVHNGLAVGLAVAAILLRTLGGRDGALKRGTIMRIAPEGHAARDGACLVFLATTLDRLMFGAWPFWGRGAGAIHWLDIEAPPRGLWRMLRAFLPRHAGSIGDAAGRRSGRAERIGLRLAEPFVLDGEFFDPGSGVLLAAGCPVTIVSP